MSNTITKIEPAYRLQSLNDWSEEFLRQVMFAMQQATRPVALKIIDLPYDINDIEEQITWDWDHSDEMTVGHFILRMRSHTPLPPVIFVDGALKDGFHRLTAAHRLGITQVPTINW
jgi:hypothetical protein